MTSSLEELLVAIARGQRRCPLAERVAPVSPELWLELVEGGMPLEVVAFWVGVHDDLHPDDHQLEPDEKLKHFKRLVEL
jgi:hypothetical protein